MMSVVSYMFAPTGGCSGHQQVNLVDNNELQFLYNHEIMYFKENKR